MLSAAATQFAVDLFRLHADAEACAVKPIAAPTLLKAVDAYARIFDTWVAKIIRIPRSRSFAVADTTVFTKSVGTDPNRPAVIASLSKGNYRSR